jgi:hypothetical protein
MIKKLLAVIVVLLLGMAAAPAFAVPVSLELALLVDVSGSVSTGEFTLQRQGYVNAFNSLAGQYGGPSAPAPFATTLVYWSSDDRQVQSVGWTLVNDAASAQGFANAVGAAGRPYTGNTAPGNAIRFARNLFTSNAYEGDRLVIDISGDGRQNEGIDTFGQATAAHAQGITINGLAILGQSGLQSWYQSNIVTPGGGFLEVANDFNDFSDAVNRKISREVNPIPEPGTMVLLGSALLGLAGVRRRKRD